LFERGADAFGEVVVCVEGDGLGELLVDNSDKERVGRGGEEKGLQILTSSSNLVRSSSPKASTAFNLVLYSLRVGASSAVEPPSSRAVNAESTISSQN
jgi:hypothetical protein